MSYWTTDVTGVIHVRRLIAIALSALGVPLCVAAAQSGQPLWKMKLDHYIIFQRLTPAGVLIVSTEHALLGVDTATGQVAWTRADIPNVLPQLAQPAPTTSFGTAAEPPATPRVSLTSLWGTPYVIVARDSANARTWIELLDAHTGGRRWSSDSLPIADVHGYHQLPDSGLLLYGRTGSGASAKMVFIAADVATGNVRWRSDTWFSEPPVEYDADGLEAGRGALDGSQWPLFDSDTTAILVWSPQGPIKVNVRSGERLWTTSRRLGTPPALSHGYPAPLLSDGVVYVSFERRLDAFSVTDGRSRFNEPAKLGGRIVQMEMTPRGLLVRGGPDWDSRQSQRGFTVRGPEPGGKRFLDLLDPATAQSRWPKRDKPIEVTSPFVRQGDAVYAATREKLYRVTLENGDAHELATFKFEAGERAEGLELRGGVLVLLSAHTLMGFDTTGQLRFSAFFPPPGPRSDERRWPSDAPARLLPLLQPRTARSAATVRRGLRVRGCGPRGQRWPGPAGAAQGSQGHRQGRATPGPRNQVARVRDDRDRNAPLFPGGRARDRLLPLLTCPTGTLNSHTRLPNGLGRELRQPAD